MDISHTSDINDSGHTYNIQREIDHRLFSIAPLDQKEKDSAYNHVTHKGYASLRKYKALSKQQIEADLTEYCGCKENCQSLLDVGLVLKWRKKVHMLVQGEEQKQKILELYSETLFANRRAQTKHIVEGNLICKEAWYGHLLKISRSTYNRIAHDFKLGTRYYTANPWKVKSEKGPIALGYMNWFVSVTGDQSPETERVLLPVGMTIQEIFKEYKQVHKEEEVVERSMFYKIWRQNFSHVTQQQNCRFTKCNVCVLSKQLLQQNLAPDIHMKVVKDREEHLMRQHLKLRQERKAYYTRRAEAVACPKEKLSLIIDGMDQSKLSLPHFQGWNAPKACDASNMLQTHVNGVLVHGIKTYNYVDLHQWPHDSNLTLNCLLSTLHTVSNDGKLPPQLFIQLDNCGRENKNKFFIGMAALLVKWGFVKEVMISFLMVGHTHEDIDSRFSKISTSLKRKSAGTLPDLLDIINNSLASGMESILMSQVYNIRDWILPYLNEIHNHQLPHVYRLYEDRTGHVSFRYKNWSADEEWLPLPSEEQLEIFKLDDNGEQMIPPGHPELVAPDIMRKQDIPAVQRNILKLKQFLTSSQNMWWSDFFTSANSMFTSDISDWYLTGLQGFEVQHQPPTENESTVSPLAIVMENERRAPNVFTGKKRKAQAQNAVNNKRKEVVCPEGAMVLYKSGEQFGVGSVVGITDDTYTVRKYRGPLNGAWKAISNPAGDFINVQILKTSVVDDGIFMLTSADYLPTNIKKLVKAFMG